MSERLSDGRENVGMCGRGCGVERGRAKAGKMGGGEMQILLNCEQLPPLISSGVSSEDTSVTHRQSWWLPKARAGTTLDVGPSSVLGLNP